jgi:CarD family transcriptional regulator
MVFQVGDVVIHSIHGLGKVVRIEDKPIHGNTQSCYVVRTENLTVWVPIENGNQHSLRAPTPKREFESLYTALNGPNEPLPEDRQERKRILRELLNDGQLTSIFRVVRDLSSFGQKKKLSDEDKAMLERAVNSLLAEWVFSLSVPLAQARQKMDELLGS